MLEIPTTQDAKIRRIPVQGQSGKKVFEIPSQSIKLSMVAMQEE
jgi:hypothetical protein